MSDLISRQDAIEAVATVTMSIHLSNVLCDKLLALPSADAVQIPIKLEKRYPQSRDEDITDAFMRGYLAGRSSADRPTGEWISEELANMICNEICYYKEVTVDADSLNDLCEGCLIKKMKYGRLTGKWIKSNLLPNGWHCSHCDAPVMTDDIEEMLFCPNCGAKMGGDSDG